MPRAYLQIAHTRAQLQHALGAEQIDVDRWPQRCLKVERGGRVDDDVGVFHDRGLVGRRQAEKVFPHIARHRYQLLEDVVRLRLEQLLENLFCVYFRDKKREISL